MRESNPQLTEQNAGPLQTEPTGQNYKVYWIYYSLN